MGGEFGQSKGVLDLYEKFFSKQQATSINQHPRALYKLSLGAGWERNLNVFVTMALKALPAKYDANIYGRFMDTWGTHVGRETLVGGMIEQQVNMAHLFGRIAKIVISRHLLWWENQAL